MKKICSNLICILLIFELFLGANAPKSLASAKPDESVTSPGAFIDATTEEAEEIFGKDGCATIDELGNVTIKFNKTTQSAVQDTSGQKSSIDCKARVQAFIPRMKRLLEIKKEAEGASTSKSSANCAECDVTSSMVLPGQVCSLNEKLKIEKERKSNSECDISCNAKAAWNNSLNNSFAIGFMEFGSTKSCNPAKNSTSDAKSCVVDLVKSLFGSLKEMGKAVWGFTKSIGSSIAGWFKTTEKLEKAATNSAVIKSGLTDQEIESAKKNGAHATYEKLSMVWKVLDTVGDYLLNLDTEKYREILSCAKCNERMSALCKVMGVVGKDVIKNFIIVAITGGVVGAIVKTPVGKKMIAWGENRAAAFTLAHAAKIEKFSSSGIGKGITLLAKGTGKILSGVTAVGEYPRKIIVKSGKKVARETYTIAKRAGLYSHTPGLAVDKVALAGELKSISTITEGSVPIKMEVPREITPAMQKSRAAVAKMKSAKRANLNGVQTAEISNFEIVNESSVRVKTEVGNRYIQAKNPVTILTYNEGQNSLIVNADHSISFTTEGKIVGKVPAEKAAEVKSLLGSEESVADKQALDKIKLTAAENGIVLEEEISSKVPGKNTEFKVKPPMDCGTGPIVITVERAL